MLVAARFATTRILCGLLILGLSGLVVSPVARIFHWTRLRRDWRTGQVVMVETLSPVSCRVILDLCGGTGSWSDPYRNAGYDVRVVDPLNGGGDVRLFEAQNAHGILAAPPCTHFSVSGARWWKGKGVEALLDGLSVVDACLRIIFACKPVWWALENPVGRLRNYLGQPKMSFNPCDYGDPYTKRTYLWGDFNPPMKKNRVLPSEGSKMHRLPPSVDRWRLRSKTPIGFAMAFFEANK